MKVLLIGGTGILSTDVCEMALNKGYDVTCLNRGHNKELQNTKANVILGNIRHVKEMQEKFKDATYDVIVDFLSFNPEQLLNTLSIFGTKCKQFVFISSATAYHKKNEDEIITENTALGNSSWQYGQDKVDCEKLLAEYCSNINLNYTIIRPYVTYGNTRIPYAVIPNHQPWSWLNRIYCEKPVVLWSGGKNACTLTHTNDFSVGVVGLFLNPAAYGEAFHITSDEKLTWKTATDHIQKAMKNKINIIDIPTEYICKHLPEYKGILLGDKSTNMVFDNTKIKKAVSEFNCKIKFEDGIKRTIEFINENDFLHIIDIKWDARLDYLITKYNRKNKIKNDRKLYHFQKCDSTPTVKEKLLYTLYRYPVFYYPCRALSRLIRKMKQVVKKILKIFKQTY